MTKDSEQVIEFMALFARLKGLSKEDPELLRDLAERDESVRELCQQIGFAADLLRAVERQSRELFAAPVDPSFVKAWRDYEQRYQRAVGDAWLGHHAQVFRDGTSVKSAWESEDEEASEYAETLNILLDFASTKAMQSEKYEILRGLDTWEYLIENVGMDIRGIIRRRALVPFVLIPRHVALGHGVSEVNSTLRYL